MELRELPPAVPKPQKRVLVRSSSSGTRAPTSMFSIRSLHQQHQHHHNHRKAKEPGTSSSGLFRRNADRQLAALHFLSNIPMTNERAILEAAAMQQHQLYPLTEGTRASPGDGEEEDDDELLLLDSPLAAAATTGGSNKENEGIHDEHAARYGIGSVLVPGKKLDGPPAYVVSVPESFRHKYQQSAAVVRQWERQVSDAGILEGRLFISSKRGYPLVVSSVIQYKPGSESEKRLRAKQVNERGAEAFDRPVPDWRGVRYCRLLHAEWAQCSAERDARDGGHHQHQLYGEGGEGGGNDAGGMVLPCGVGSGAYDPSFLDDPALSHGRTRQLNMGGPGLGPIVYSVILFRNPKQLKDELNRQFREQHPSLPPSLTLSKIRRLKKQAAQGCYHALDIELGTLALAVAYFEKLCLQSLVTKTNRRLAFATCLVLAYKFQEQGLQGEGGREGGWEGGRGGRSSSAGSGGSVRNSSNKLSLLLEWIDRELLVSKRQVLDAEFGVYYHLGFALHVPAGEPQFHFSRLCRLVGVSPREYLGEERLRDYMEAAAGMVPGVVGWREGGEGEEEEEEEEGGGGGEEEEEEEGDEDYGLEETVHGNQDHVEEEDEEEEDELGGSLWRRGRRLRRQGQRQRQRRTAVSLPAQRGRRDFERDGELLEEDVPDALAFFQQESPGRVRGLEEEEEEEEEGEKKPRRRPSWTMRGWKLGRRQSTV